jgi:predicted PurR-regulated permease PerM
LRSEAFQWFVRGVGFALGVAVVAIILGGFALAGRVVVLIFIALLLASGLQPVVDWTRARSRLGRGATVLIVYAAFFVAVAVLALLVLPGALSQFNDLGARLAPLLDNARAWAGQIEPRALSASLTALIDSFQGAIAPGAGEGADPDAVIAVGITAADFAISLASVLAMVFFWLTERARLQRFALALVPAPRRQGTREAWNEIELRLGSWVRGQLILMSSMGVMTTVAYFLLGLEGALLLGVIAGLAEAIPIVGPIIGVIPALVVAAMTGSIELVLLVAVVYTVIQVVESNVLVPLVMRNAIGIPPFLVIASILAGAAIAGVLGALMAVPVAASLLVVLERLQARDEHVPLDRPSVEADALTPDPTAGEELASDRQHAAGGRSDR